MNAFILVAKLSVWWIIFYASCIYPPFEDIAGLILVLSDYIINYIAGED